MSKTPEPWELQRGFSDWGMNCQHTITEGNTVIAHVPSLTPYCIGAKSKDKEYARRQWENAKLIASSRELKEIALEFLDRVNRFGNWDDGCFYYNKTSASELEGLIEKVTDVLEKLSE